MYGDLHTFLQYYTHAHTHTVATQGCKHNLSLSVTVIPSLAGAALTTNEAQTGELRGA